MMKKIQQGIITKNLNKYFQSQNLSLTMNDEGVCNGLALVYAKYFLEGKEDEFWKMLEYIASNKLNKKSTIDLDEKDDLSYLEKEGHINYFASEILLSFVPELYNQKLNQANAMQMLKIDGKPLQTSFEFSIATSTNNWAEIFKSLNLQKDEIIHVSSSNHAIAICKKDELYRIYNPNYPEGYKEFKNEKEVMFELHKNVFEYNKGNLGLHINLISHPDSKKRTFPSPTELYEKYLSNFNDTATTSSSTFSTLNQAVLSNDSDRMDYLLKRREKEIKKNLETDLKINEEIESDSEKDELIKDKDIIDAAQMAVIRNCDQALKSILTKIDDAPTIYGLMDLALEKGRLEAFKQLLTHNISKNYFEKLNDIKEIETLIENAATGGNPELLVMVIDLVKTNCKSWKEVKLRDSINLAIASGSTECVKKLVNELKENGNPLTIKDKVYFLEFAFEKNQDLTASYLINSEPKFSKNDITKMKETNPDLLLKILDKKLNVNETKQTTNSLLETVERITSWIKEKLNTNKTSNFKNRIQEIKKNNIDIDNDNSPSLNNKNNNL